MHEKLEKIKQHLIDHKEAYIAGGACLVVGAAGGVLLTRNVAVTQKAQNVALLNWKPFNFLQQTVVVDLPARGRRGDAIVNDATLEVYGSIREAASKIGCAPATLRSHLRGEKDNIYGNTYSNLGENLSERVVLSN